MTAPDSRYVPQLNLRGVLHEALTFILDHADKDEDAEKWTLTMELRARLQALARGPQQAGGEDWQLIDGKRSADGLAYSAVYWCANTGALKTETTSDGRFRAGDGPRIRRPTGYAALQAEVARLTADRDSWCDQASDRLKDWDEMRQRAEAHLPSTPQSEGREMLDREVAEKLRRARLALVYARVSAGFQDAGESARDLWELEMECRRAG